MILLTVVHTLNDSVLVLVDMETCIIKVVMRNFTQYRELIDILNSVTEGYHFVSDKLVFLSC